jgi:hypothetical protein
MNDRILSMAKEKMILSRRKRRSMQGCARN